MPVVNSQQLKGPTRFPRIDDPGTVNPNPSPTAGEIWRAALGAESPTYNAVLGNVDRGEFDPDYNPYDHMEGYEYNADALAGAINAQDMALRKMAVDRRQSSQRVMEAAGGWGTAASFAAAGLDPMFLPLLAAGPGAGALRAGLGRAAGEFAAWGVAETALSEAVLQAYQPTRSATETAINITAGALFGGLIGGGARVLKGGGAPDIIPPPKVDVQKRVLIISALDDEMAQRPVYLSDGRPIAGDPTAEVNRLLRASEERLLGNDRVAALRGERFSLLNAIDAARSTNETLTKKLLPRLKAKQEAAQAVRATTGIARAEARAVVRSLGDDIARVNAEVDANIAKIMESQNQLQRVVEGLDDVTAKAAFDVANITEWRERGFDDSEILNALNQGRTPDAAPKPDPSLLNAQYQTVTVKMDRAKALSDKDFLEQQAKGAKNAGMATPGGNDSAGAARASAAAIRAQADMEVYSFGAMSNTAAKMTGFGRSVTSASRVATERAVTLAENAWRFTTGGELTATPTAVETLVKRWTHGMVALINRDNTRRWKAYRQRVTAEGGQAMDHTEFRSQVSAAMLDGDAHAIPEIDASAKDVRRRLYDPLFKEALAERMFDEHVLSGITAFQDSLNTALKAAKVKNSAGKDLELTLPKDDVEVLLADLSMGRTVEVDDVVRMLGDMDTDVENMARDLLAKPLTELMDSIGKSKTSPSYLNRLYNRHALVAREPQALQVFENYIRKGNPKATDEAIRQEAQRLLGDIKGNNAGASDFFAVYNKNGIEAGKAGPTMARTLMIPDKVLREAGLLIEDIDTLTGAYARSLAPRIELAKASRGRGEASAWRWDEDLKEISDDFQRQITEVEADATLTPAQKVKRRRELDAQQTQTAEDMKVMIERLLGTYDMPANPSSFISRMPSWIKSANYMSMMGGMVVSSVPDVARLVMTHGLRHSVGTLLTQPGAVKRLWKANLQDMNEYGAATDMLVSMRTRQMVDLDDAPAMTRNEMRREAAVQNFSIISGMAPWNAMLKGYAGLIGQSRLLKLTDDIAKGKRVSKEDRAWMLSNGIDDNMAQRIASQPMNRNDTLWLGNTDAWGDHEAVNVYRAALTKIADTTIVTKGIGDMPNRIKGPWVGLLLQYKSFAITAVNRMIIPLAQSMAAKELRAYSGMLAAVGMGTLVYQVKAMLREGGTDKQGEVAQEWDDALGGDAAAMGKILAGAVNHSGLLGISSEFGAAVPVLTGGVDPAEFAAWALAGEDLPDSSQWNAARAMTVLAGPTASQVAQIGPAAGNLLLMQNTEQGWNATRRLLPYQNLFYLQNVINVAEQKLKDQAE